MRGVVKEVEAYIAVKKQENLYDVKYSVAEQEKFMIFLVVYFQIQKKNVV